MKSTTRVLAALATAALFATACGEAPDTTESETDTGSASSTETSTDTETDTETPTDGATTQAADYAGCMVTDTGGVDDGSFNETAFAGIEQAAEEFGIETKVLESGSPADFAPNINAFVEQDCDLIVAVGFLLEEATANAAEANPDQNFAIVDVDFFDPDAGEDITYDNVRELTFATDQAAFLAGYVAAAMTETGTVGTYGGLNIPSVTIFMDGYLAGVEYYNQENDADVQVLGWDGEEGQFSGDFEDQTAGRNITESMLQNGADIIMPVAGPVGLGTAAALQAAGTGKMIWVDTDGFENPKLQNFTDLILTSVEKKMDQAVYDTIAMDIQGEFDGGLYVGTLENEGVGIAPFHEFEDDVPQEVKDTLDELRQGIIDGSISVDPADYQG